MNALLLIVIITAVIAFFLAMTKGKGGSRGYPYQRKTYLLSKAERSFYGVLVQAVGNSGVVFSKVRAADVISPKKGLSRSEWQRAFNAISAKHFDFIVCEPNDCSIRLAVELDDSSHGSSKTQKRDELINEACESGGLPLLRIKAARTYSVTELQRLIGQAISHRPGRPEGVEADIVAEPPVRKEPKEEKTALTANLESDKSDEEKSISTELQETKSESRACPKCGEQMVRRRAKSGANAGKVFWGCSAFPKCRTVVPTDA